jgi:hypothetical protein
LDGRGREQTTGYDWDESIDPEHEDWLGLVAFSCLFFFLSFPDALLLRLGGWETKSQRERASDGWEKEREAAEPRERETLLLFTYSLLNERDNHTPSIELARNAGPIISGPTSSRWELSHQKSNYFFPDTIYLTPAERCQQCLRPRVRVALKNQVANAASCS